MNTFAEPASGVVDAVAAPLPCALEPVWVHGGQDVEVGRGEDAVVGWAG